MTGAQALSPVARQAPTFVPMPFGRQKPTRAQRARRGQMAHYGGLAAEHRVARKYEAFGCTVRERRFRTPEGELDLIVDDGNVLVFVEVKKRKYSLGPDCPISARQWQRLENAANHYIMMMFGATGIQPICRFDVAMVDGAGQVTIIENARVVEEF